jgi:hypothetical protein
VEEGSERKARWRSVNEKNPMSVRRVFAAGRADDATTVMRERNVLGTAHSGIEQKSIRRNIEP